MEPAVIGYRKDGRPIYPISGGESDDDLPIKPNAMRRIGYSAEQVEQAVLDRERRIKSLRVRDRLSGLEDVSTAAIVSRYSFQDPTDQEIAAAQEASSKR